MYKNGYDMHRPHSPPFFTLGIFLQWYFLPSFFKIHLALCKFRRIAMTISIEFQIEKMFQVQKCFGYKLFKVENLVKVEHFFSFFLSTLNWWSKTLHRMMIQDLTQFQERYHSYHIIYT